MRFLKHEKEKELAKQLAEASDNYRKATIEIQMLSKERDHLANNNKSVKQLLGIYIRYIYV